MFFGSDVVAWSIIFAHRLLCRHVRRVVAGGLRGGLRAGGRTPVGYGRGWGSRMLRGLMLRRRAVRGTPKCEKSVGAPDPTGGAYSALPDPLAGGKGALLPPSPRTSLTILSLCLSCVYVHTCMKMHCYFILNVKHGASQLYLGGGGSNYLAPALRYLNVTDRQTDRRTDDLLSHYRALR